MLIGCFRDRSESVFLWLQNDEFFQPALLLGYLVCQSNLMTRLVLLGNCTF